MLSEILIRAAGGHSPRANATTESSADKMECRQELRMSQSPFAVQGRLLTQMFEGAENQEAA